MLNRKQKIIYGITKGNWGGAQCYVYDLVTSLPADKYEIKVIIGIDGDLGSRLRQKGITVIILGDLVKNVSLIKDLAVLFRLIKILFKEKPDIIHLNSSKMGLLGVIAGRIAQVKKIFFTAHGWAFNEDRSKKARYFIRLAHIITIWLATATIAVSLKTKNDISEKLQKKMVVIRNGIDTINFLNQDQARNFIFEKITNKQNITGLETRPWIGTISELHKNKGLKYIIEAIHIQKMSSATKETLPLFFIIGEGERRKKIEERIKRYNLENEVFLLGQIADARIYLKAFDIFTLTSITEALPYVILEAGLANLPVIASSVGGIPEIITDQESGLLVKPRDPREIAEAIKLLLTNTQKRVDLANNLGKKILTEFSRSDMVNQTIALYN